MNFWHEASIRLARRQLKGGGLACCAPGDCFHEGAGALASRGALGADRARGDEEVGCGGTTVGWRRARAAAAKRNPLRVLEGASGHACPRRRVEPMGPAVVEPQGSAAGLLEAPKTLSLAVHGVDISWEVDHMNSAFANGVSARVVERERSNSRSS